MRHLLQGARRDGQVRQNHRGVVRHQVVNDMGQLSVDHVDHLVVDEHHVDQFSDLVLVDVQQNRDELNLVAVLTLEVAHHQVMQVVVDENLMKFQMDYFHRALLVDVAPPALVQLLAQKALKVQKFLVVLLVLQAE